MEFPSFSRWSQLGQLRSSFNMTRYIVKGFASGKHSGDAKDHFLESGRETIKTLNADGKGTEKTVSQIQWSQEKTRNSHLHSSVSQAGSQMVGSTLQTPFPSPHRTSSPQVTCTPSLITEQGQRARSASGAHMAPAPDRAGCSCASSQPTGFLVFFLRGHLFLTCLTAAARFPSGQRANNMGSGR